MSLIWQKQLGSVGVGFRSLALTVSCAIKLVSLVHGGHPDLSSEMVARLGATWEILQGPGWDAASSCAWGWGLSSVGGIGPWLCRTCRWAGTGLCRGALETRRSSTSSITGEKDRHLPVFMICLHFQFELWGKGLKMHLKNENRFVLTCLGLKSHQGEQMPANTGFGDLLYHSKLS